MRLLSQAKCAMPASSKFKLQLVLNKFLYILFVPNASFEVHHLNSIENLAKLITEAL